MSRERWYRATIAAGRTALAALDLTTRWSGEEHLPTEGPVLLASAHVAYPDFLFVGRAALSRGRYVRFMCRHDVWNRRLLARAMDGMGHIPVDREAPAAAYLRARRLLREGEAVCAFPEAGISHSFTVRALMRGVAALARDTGAPVVPVVLWGSQRLATVGRPGVPRRERIDLSRGRLVDVRFGPALPAVGPGADLTEVTRQLGHTLTGMLEALQTLPEHQPGPGEVAPWHPAHLGGHAPDRREALLLDLMPRSAVAPSWGPPIRH